MEELKNILSADLPDRQFTTTHKISPKAVRSKLKRESAQKMKEKKAGELIDRLPESGEAIHIVSAGIFDYWTLIPVIAGMLGEKIEQSRFSTWAMTMPVCHQFIAMMDSGELGDCGFIADRSLQRMQGAVYAQLVTRFNAANMPLRMTNCHAKVSLIKTKTRSLTIEGSANFTNNPRIEQFCVINDQGVYDFHFKWMQELFDADTND
jgi:hypothetical protein